MAQRCRIALGVLVALVAISGCATRTYRADAAPTTGAPPTLYGTQVAIGECVFKPPGRAPAVAGAIATALASGAIAQGVNHLGRAIEEAAKATNDRVVASRNLEVSAQTFGPCVQVVRGVFYRGFDDPAQRKGTFEDATRTWARGAFGVLDEGRLSALWQRRLWVAAQPDFVFEAEIVPSDVVVRQNTRLLTLAPVYARLDEPISQSTLRRSAAREVAMFFAFHEATSEPTAPSNASGGLALGRLEPAVDVRFPPSEASTVETPNRSPTESRWFTLALTEARKPMTVTALVTEHQDASAFLEFLADVLGAAKSPVTAALQTSLVPSVAAQAEEAETARLEALHTAYEEALNRSLGAATACSAKTGDALDAASELRGRLRTFNRHARALRRDSIEESLVPLSVDAGAVQAGCARVRDALRRLL